ncbi:MAG: N-methyl-L-tryptophan oxidase [Cardiobacteriaceae bacterium]|nr:N-methyl-L-tryptophan oxidase [Cardiobacteriaceae bacterium]
MNHFPLAIIGSGTFGLAGAYYTSPRLPILLLDAHTPPHTFGAHHGETRLFRYLYQTHDYQILLNRAKALWQDLERKHDAGLLQRCGVVNLAYEGHPMPDNCRQMAEAYDLPYEMMSAAEVNRRWSGWRVPAHYRAIFEPEAGYSDTDKTLRLFLHHAKEHGATTAFNNPVLAIEPKGERFLIITQTKRFVADKLVISAGTWVNRIQGLGWEIPFTPVRKTFAWYDAPQKYHQQQGFTGFTAITENGIYYGFPDAGAGLKVGRHDEGEIMATPLMQSAFGTYPSDAGDTNAFLANFLPEVGALREGKVCSYDRSAGEDFIIQKHPEHESILLLSGFSGHGFKFAPVIGEQIATFALA